MNMQVPIKIFIHATLINDWYEILKYILDKIVESGLSADMDRCFVGALGDESEVPKLKQLLAQYEKTELRCHDTDKSLWENFTVKQLKHDCDTQPHFYGIYCHTKSVTRQYDTSDEHKNNEKKYSVFWLHYMCWSVIERWRDNYAALSMPDIGYELAGCRAIPKRISASQWAHYSGTFYMFNSEYIKTLRPIEDSDFKNIFFAEEYPFFNQPLMYIACNAFTQGMPYQKTFAETLAAGYPIKNYCTDITHTL